MTRKSNSRKEHFDKYALYYIFTIFLLLLGYFIKKYSNIIINNTFYFYKNELFILMI